MHLKTVTPTRHPSLFKPTTLGRYADLIAVGRPFIANPDLPARIANGWPLSPLDTETVYGGAERDLTDYPAHTPPPSFTQQEVSS